MKQEEIAKLFPAHIRQALLAAHFDMDQVYEIRLRVNAPLIVIYQGKEYFLTREGEFSREESQGCFVRAEDLKETMEYVSSYSMYAFEEEIRQGFITIQGGHRVGIAGKTVLEGDRIKSVKYIFLYQSQAVTPDKRLCFANTSLYYQKRQDLPYIDHLPP